jgi:hypothetical protein
VPAEAPRRSRCPALRTPPGHSRPGAWARFAAFRDAIEDDTDYAVKAIDVPGPETLRERASVEL